MTDKLAPLEQLKVNSNYLRGTIQEGLDNPLTGAISEQDNLLLKFHGSYQQDNRDLRDERRKQKLEPAHSFMVRARLPGGVITPEQWLIFDQIATDYAEFGLRITTRQTFQWHGVLKRNLKKLMQGINRAHATTIAACGDVNRQVVSVSNPLLSKHHAAVLDWAQKISDYFLPATNAYAEIWLDGKKVDELTSNTPSLEPTEVEPIYGQRYLPRKFKIGLTIPPTNDVDVFAQDMGLIAIVENDELIGFNLTIGGGMGCTHGDDTTYARLGSVVGFVTLDDVMAAAEAVITLQRDHGNRAERRYARFKYTVDQYGVDWFKEQIESRAGITLHAPKAWQFDTNGDRFGWVEGENGQWHLGLRIDSGRLIDRPGAPLLTGMREIAKVHTGHFRLTCNQNLIIADVSFEDRAAIDALVETYSLDGYKTQSGIWRNTIACVSLPTCALGMAESERYAPIVLPKLNQLLEKYDLLDQDIVFRISGCPNGCARPYMAEISLVGRAPGRYDLRLGGDRLGERLNTVYKTNIPEEEILSSLDALFARFAAERLADEHFGDFLIRTEIIAAPTQRQIPIVLELV